MDSKCKNGINIIKLLKNLGKIQKLVKKGSSLKKWVFVSGGWTKHNIDF